MKQNVVSSTKDETQVTRIHWHSWEDDITSWFVSANERDCIEDRVVDKILDKVNFDKILVEEEETGED